jgi:diadenosine tetraphosphate (Ap4A) HIT family hydrolase
MTTTSGCVFCSIIAGRAPAIVVREWDDAIAIQPHGGGVTDGHLLVISRTHVSDVAADPAVSGATMARAAELAAGLPGAHVITSRGAAATQTVQHLHIHVVPRTAGDGLPLPWTPRQPALAATPRAEPSAAPHADPSARPRAEPSAGPHVAGQHWTLGATPTGIRLVGAREPVPDGPSVFLAGPTPDARAPVPSWRPDAIAALAEQWTGAEPLIVLSPESRGGVPADRYEDQVAWETQARAAATAIAFWIPRDMATLPGMTTNVEFGLDVGTGRAVLGCPPDCPNPERNRYLIYIAHRHDIPVRTTLDDTITAALAIVRPPSPASHGKPHE